MLMINLRDGSGKKTAIYSHITIQGARRLEMKKNVIRWSYYFAEC